MSAARRVALLFPGQGTLAPGMGGDVLRAVAGLPDALDTASGVVDLDVVDLSRRAPLDVLRRTEVAQRLVVAWGIALWQTTLVGIRPVAVAGHSVGGLAAAAAAGALEPEAALGLVAERSDAMAALGDTGSMTAVEGPGRADVEQLVAVHPAVTLALANTATTHVLSGPVEALDALEGEASARRWRTRRLAVGGAFHSPAMAPAAPRWHAALDRARIENPAHPLVVDLDGRVAPSAARVRDALARQLTAPVEWHEATTAVLASAPTDVIEVGCSRALCGWVRRRAPEVRTWSLGDARQVRDLRRELAAAAVP